jgi:hypothetical protein
LTTDFGNIDDWNLERFGLTGTQGDVLREGLKSLAGVPPKPRVEPVDGGRYRRLYRGHRHYF